MFNKLFGDRNKTAGDAPNMDDFFKGQLGKKFRLSTMVKRNFLKNLLVKTMKRLLNFSLSSSISSGLSLKEDRISLISGSVGLS